MSRGEEIRDDVGEAREGWSCEIVEAAFEG
jgi:hypothetical protein